MAFGIDLSCFIACRFFTKTQNTCSRNCCITDMPVDNSPAYLPMLSIHPNRLNFYGEAVNPRMVRPDRSLSNLNHGFKRTPDTLSPGSRRKISKAIDYLLFLSSPKCLPATPTGRGLKFRIAFVTLTLPSPQVHSDQVVKEQCLNQLLIELRKQYKVRNYIWRAEKQVNGNIHFHLLIDKFVPWSELRDRWNRICNKLCYVDRYRDQMRSFHNGGFKIRADLLKTWAYKSQIRAYQKGKANDWSSPNSTDIHSIRRISNVSAYLSKYYCKDEQNKGLTGRMWGCNYELSDIPGARVTVDRQVYASCQALFRQFHPHFYRGDYFTCIDITTDMLNQTGTDLLFKLFATFILDHFNTNIQLDINST